MGPKESSLGLHCTSVQSWGSFFLRVLVGIVSRGAGLDLLPQELGRGDGMREG